MTLSSPVEISPSLLPGVRIGEAWVSIDYADREGSEGRTRYQWQIVLEGHEYAGDDLQSGCGGGGLREGLDSLLSFLGAFAESWRYAGAEGENADLFPAELAEWAMQNSDEIGMAAMEVEENKECIVE